MSRVYKCGLSIDIKGLPMRLPIVLRVQYSIAVALAIAAPPAQAADPSQVLVVVNDSSPTSVAIGNYYAALRSIPGENMLHLPPGTTTQETLSRDTFNSEVRDPIIQYLSVTKPHLKDQVQYITLCKYVPLRISGAGVGTSVEAELCLLFTGLLSDLGSAAKVTNPFFSKEQTFSTFSHPDIKYLVCRLDGYETPVDPGTGIPTDVKGLIDRAQGPAASGTFLFDMDSSKTGGSNIAANSWLSDAAANLADLSQQVILESTTSFLPNVPSLIGYSSWGSEDCCEVPVGSGAVYPGATASIEVEIKADTTPVPPTAVNPAGFTYRPVMAGPAAVSIGQPVSLFIAGKSGDALVLFIGSTAANQPVPLHGTLLLDPTAFFAPLLQQTCSFPADSATVQFRVPNDGALVGLVARFQSVVGDLVSGSPGTFFTNRLDLTIEP